MGTKFWNNSETPAAVWVSVMDSDELAALRDKAEFADEYAARIEDEKRVSGWLRDYNGTLGAIVNEYADAYFAGREAVEVLEDMYAQRDDETDRWFRKWLDAYGAVGVWRSCWQSQRDESERLAAQVADLAAQNADLTAQRDGYELMLADARNLAADYKRWNKNQARMISRARSAAIRGNSRGVLDELDDASDFE